MNVSQFQVKINSRFHYYQIVPLCFLDDRMLINKQEQLLQIALIHLSRLLYYAMHIICLCHKKDILVHI